MERNSNKKYIACISTFDGFNKEHLKLVLRTKKLAKKNNLEFCAIIDDKKLHQFFYTIEERKYFLKQLGIKDIFCKSNCNVEFSKLISETDICKNLDIIRKKQINALSSGDVENYRKVSGFNYLIIGSVCHGLGLGRTVGMPTANLELNKYKIFPKDAVYGSIVYTENAIKAGLTNLGNRPSIDNNKKKLIETNILDFNQDIYYKKIIIKPCVYIRDIVKFNGLDEVKHQVDKDKIKVITKLQKYVVYDKIHKKIREVKI